MTTQMTSQNIGWFIDTVLLENIRDMICTQNQHYLGFGVVACAVEFLGACMDGFPFEQQGVSRQRFESAIKTNFDKKYHPYADKNSKYDLYNHLRCGMAHVMRPQGKIAFTTHSESITDNTQHLHVLASLDKLVLISEPFYADFAEASKKMKQHMAAGAYTKKLTDCYLPITQVSP